MPVYSYSRIGCYENCPRQYKFKYIEKPDIEKVDTIEAYLGSRAHETLERCYRLALQGRVLSREEVTALFERLWKENHPEKARVVREEMTADDYLVMGRKALDSFYTRQYPFDQEQTLGLEQMVTFALDTDGGFRMQGYIDRIGRDKNGQLRIHDYKTSGHLPTQQDADGDAQLGLYQIAVQKMWPDNNGVELVWHYLQFDTDLVSRRTSQQLEELKETYIGNIRRIEKRVELGNFPTNETTLCQWCEYFALCPAKSGKGVEAPSQTVLTDLSPQRVTALVDEYLVLDRGKKEAEKRIEEIRTLLVQMGEAGSSRFFRGSGNEGILVALSKVVKLPTKSANEKAFNEIEAIVREAGLLENFSSFDIGYFQKALNEGQLPPAVAEKIKPYETETISDRLRIKKSE